MGSYLLIGNGLNICVSENYSTKSILLEHTIFNKDEIDTLINNKGIGFPSIIEASFEKNSDYDSVIELFKNIREKLKYLNKKKNDIYSIMKDNFNLVDGIITTNYDFGIEYNVFGLKPETKAIRRNCGYYFDSNGKKVYHIHGDFNHIKNLCLGYFGYQKYLKSSFSNLSFRLKKEKDIFQKLEKRLPISLYRFLVDDIYVIGLGLTESELIIWSILTLRRELIRRDLYSFCGVKENEIIFYECYKNEEKNEYNSFMRSLSKYYKCYFINYKCEQLIDKDYDSFYKESLNKIFKKIKKRNNCI